MSDLNQDELKKHVSDKDTWLRFVYIVVLWVAFYLTALIAFAITVFQFLAKLFSGAAYIGLKSFGANIALYQAQITRFVTYATDEKPFPFAPFPGQITKPTASTDIDPRL
jgi:hypothetical protein